MKYKTSAVRVHKERNEFYENKGQIAVCSFIVAAAIYCMYDKG